MSILLPIEGSLSILTYLHDSLLPAKDWTGRLYVNDHTPALADTFSDYTAAAYVNDVTMYDLYSAPVVDPDVGAVMVADEVLFTQEEDATQTAYGWYVVDSDDNVVFAERFRPPILLQYEGDFVRLTNHRFKAHN